MMDMHLQALRAALAELQGDIKSTAGPQAQTKINIVSFLLAHAIVGGKETGSPASIAEELEFHKTRAEQEQALIHDMQKPADDADLSVEALTTYLGSRLGGSVRVTEAKRLVGGASKQTVIIKVEGDEALGKTLVLRRDLPGGPVEARACDEYSILKLVYEQGLPVAEPLFGDAAPPFGGTCLVTRMVAGSQAADLTDVEAREGGTLAALALAKVLAQVHTARLDGLEIDRQDQEISLQQRIASDIDVYEAQWVRRRVRVSPTIAAGLQWLRDNIPQEGDVSLVHGDASLRNLMMENGEATAILDWELWHIGDRHEDLAYCQLDVLPRCEWEEFLATYRAHGGGEVNPATLQFWSTFGAVRNMIFSEALVHSFATSQKPSAASMYMAVNGGRPLTQMVAAQID